MLKNKIHFSKRTGAVIAVGELSGSTSFVEIENSESVIAAINARQAVRVVNGQIVIEESAQTATENARSKRDGLLNASDILVMKLDDQDAIDGTPDTAKRQALAIYRQALRDITKQPDIFNINWPEAPQI